MISQRMLQTKFKFQTPGGQGQAMAGAHKFRSQSVSDSKEAMVNFES